MHIRIYNDPILFKKCDEVTLEEMKSIYGPDENADTVDRFYNLLGNMFDTMKEFNGVGLAAPQVGISKRIIALLLQNNSKLVIINPVVLDKSEEMITSQEGCLSLPTISCTVKRHKEITLSWFDEEFINREGTFVDDEAIRIQHELDHLDGILIIHKISEIQKQLIKKSLRKLEKLQKTFDKISKLTDLDSSKSFVDLVSNYPLETVE